MYNKDGFKYKNGYKKFYLVKNWDCIGFKLKKEENIKDILKKLKGEITPQEYNLLNSLYKNKKRIIVEGGLYKSYFKLF